MAPNGSVLLFHIGAELPPGCLKRCAAAMADNEVPQPLPSCPTSTTHGTSVAVADSFEGPWTRWVKHGDVHLRSTLTRRIKPKPATSVHVAHIQRFGPSSVRQVALTNWLWRWPTGCGVGQLVAALINWLQR
jgi:hypothetical protein